MSNPFKVIFWFLLVVAIANNLLGSISGIVLTIWSFVFLMAEYKVYNWAREFSPSWSTEKLNRWYFSKIRMRFATALTLALAATVNVVFLTFGILK